MKPIRIFAFMVFFLPLTLGAAEIMKWTRVGGDPSGLSPIQAIDSLLIPPDTVKYFWKIMVETEQWEILWIHNGDTLPELLFGGKKSRTYKHWNTTVCDWKGVDSLSAKIWTYDSWDTLETADSFKIFIQHWSYVRFDTCGNATWLYQGQRKAEKKYVPPPPPPDTAKIVEAPVVAAEEKPKKHLGISWIGKASHWNNDANKIISYQEAGLGLRFTWPEVFDDKYFENSNFHLEADVWPIMLRVHSVNNGDGHSVQLPLFQVQPKFFWRPTRSVFLMATDALTLNRRGWDSNTAMALGQLHFFSLSSGRFQPMLQIAVSQTDSRPRYLGDNFWAHNQYPESWAQYGEIKPRLRILRFGDFVSLGWECTWFHFQKTRVDPDLTLTHDLQYISNGSPNPGGPFAVFQLPWYLNADLSIVCEHIDSKEYKRIGTDSKWTPGENNEWRINLVIARNFFLQLW